MNTARRGVPERSRWRRGGTLGHQMGPATLDRAGFGFGDSLRLGDVRKLYASEVVSGAGDGVFWVALVVYLSQQPQFGLWLTLAVIARLAPRALLSLPAGSLRRSRQCATVADLDRLRARR